MRRCCCIGLQLEVRGFAHFRKWVYNIDSKLQFAPQEQLPMICCVLIQHVNLEQEQTGNWLLYSWRSALIYS